MKKSFFVALTGIAIMLSFESFTTKTKMYDKHYGGSATITVEAKQSSICPYAMLIDKVEEGEQRIITVTVDCHYDTESAAKSALKDEIKYDKKCYEKEVSSIIFDIDVCDE